VPEPILSRLERDQFWEALIEKFPRQIENWSMEDGTEPGPRMTHGTSVLACVFSPDGSLIAGAGGGCLPGCDGSIRIWDSKTGKEEQVCRGHICGIYDLAFDPLTGILASASEDYSVVLWNLEQRDTISLAGGPPVVKGHVAFAGTVPRIAIGEVMCYEEEECCVYVIDLNTGMEIFRKLAGYDKCIGSMAFSSGGNHIVFSTEEIDGSEDSILWCYDLVKSEAIWQRELRDTNVMDLVYHGGDGLIVASLSLGSIPADYGCGLRVLDPRSGETCGEMTEMSEEVPVLVIATSPMEDLIVCVMHDGRVELRNIPDLELVKNLPKLSWKEPARACSAQFSPNGRTIIIGDSAGGIHTYER